VTAQEQGVPEISSNQGRAKGHLFWECTAPRVYLAQSTGSIFLHFFCPSQQAGITKKEEKEVRHFEK
jgi:hypothetical protein